MTPYASRAARALNIPIDFILIQWEHESARGTSAIAKENLNHAGLKLGKHVQVPATVNRGHAKYNSLDDFTTDYIRVMSLSYYKNVIGVKTVEDAIREIGKTPYAEDKKYSAKLMNLFKGGKPIQDNSGGGGGVVDNSNALTSNELAVASSIGIAVVLGIKTLLGSK
jgi:flagellum-specific peptidoglycan hydrolase FlgJ